MDSPRTMRARLLRATQTLSPNSRPLEAVQCARPRAGPGQVLIAVHVCAVCHTELDEIEGRVAAQLPVIPGHQVVGTVCELGRGVEEPPIGTRVGVGWIHSACGQCEWCRSGRENLCPDFRGTGCHAHGGYAEFMTAPAAFVHPIPDALSDEQAAPMLCGGAIGLRSLRLAGLDNGQALGLTGFGGSNHQVLRLAQVLHPDSPVLVWARDPDQRERALADGAAWAGDTAETPPQQPAAIIDTTPVWTPVVAALAALAPGGKLVVNAIAKETSDIDALTGLDYPRHLWREKTLQSVANVTRADIADFLALAAEHVSLRPHTRIRPLAEANEALLEMRFGPIRGATVLSIRPPGPAAPPRSRDQGACEQ